MRFSPALFATLVLMAIVTTVMVSPLFKWLVGRHGPVSEAEPERATG